MRRGLRSASWLGLLGLFACGGESNQQQGAGGTGGSSAGTGGSSAGTGGSSAGTGGSACPSAPPNNGDPCTLQTAGSTRADCSYGDDVRPACRTLARCLSGRWQVTPPDASCSEPPLPSACPASPATMGTACSDTTLACWYDDGTHCACSGCRNGSPYPVCQTIDPPEWACTTPPSGCPNPLPQAGEPCTQANLSCGPSCEEPIRCENGVWVYGQINCPICAAPDTPIATPDGERAIAELQVGDLVYSVEHDAIVAVPLLRVGSTRVTAHRVVRVELESGRVLELSPGHPTADGRHFADLTAGGRLDEQHAVRRVELVPYRYERTYDILPASSSGTYFAAGALIGSTLVPRASH